MTILLGRGKMFKEMIRVEKVKQKILTAIFRCSQFVICDRFGLTYVEATMLMTRINLI
jgi:hypothetical protein